MGTVYYVAASLDGFVADRDNSLDWLLQFGMEEFQETYDAFYANVGTAVMGATTYEWLLAEDEPWGFTDRPVWVFTHRELPVPAGADVRFVAGDVAAEQPRIAESAGGRDVWMMGGGHLAAQYADAGLIDELILTVMPVALGAGHALLPVRAHLPLRLTATTSFPSGAVELRYAVGGADAEGTART